MNASLKVPEVVIVGHVGSGKSSFLDALLDMPIAVSRKG
jgi:hypothetical protein